MILRSNFLRVCTGLAVLSLGLLVALPGTSHARPGARRSHTLEATQADLKNVKRQIEAIERDMAQTKTSEAEAAKAVGEAEREVSRVTRTLLEVEAERSGIEAELAAIEREKGAIEARMAVRKGQLASGLRRYHMAGGDQGARAMLSERNPNQIVRDAWYLERLSRAQMALIEGQRADARAVQARLAEIERYRDALTRIEAEHKKQQMALEATTAQRRKALAGVADKLAIQR